MSLVRKLGSIIAGSAVGLAWLTIWSYLFRARGFSPLQRKEEDRDKRRELMKQMGKLTYILIFGVLGYGLACGLALTTCDYLWQNEFRWTFALYKLVFSTLLFGCWQGIRSWSQAFPVPFPPNYPPAKTKQGYF